MRSATLLALLLLGAACGDSNESSTDGTGAGSATGTGASGPGGTGAGNTGSGGASSSTGGGGVGGGGGDLLDQADLVYQGAFRVPAQSPGCSNFEVCSFAYGGGPIVFRPGHESLYMTGHVYNQHTAELAIPTVVNGSSLGALSTATFVQTFADLSDGNRENLLAGGQPIDNGAVLGGMLVVGDRLLVSSYGYYDASVSAVYTHFFANADFTTNGVGFGGLEIVGGPDVPQAGFVAGYMSAIPPEWQGQFGGTAITGLSTIPIISRTSLGPAAFVFDPAEVGVEESALATALVHYPIDNWTLGTYDSVNDYMNMSTSITGVVFVQGSRSVLFFGRHGETACYGEGTSNPALDGQPVPGGGGEVYCYDPADSSKGTHGYPYHHQVWAYDAEELLAVKNGSKAPWDAVPYAIWSFDLPFQTESRSLAGAAYDPATQRIFLSQRFGDGELPVVHVFQVAP